MKTRYVVDGDWAIACLIRPVKSVWKTIKMGYRVSIWLGYPDGEEVCIASREGFASARAARGWAKRRLARA